MRDTFREYFCKPDESLLERAVIVLDANILLDLLRMSVKSRNELLSVLEHEQIAERLWMPYQVGSEFFRNKDAVVPDLQKEIDTLNSKFTQGFKSLKGFHAGKQKRDKKLDVENRTRVDFARIEKAIDTAKDEVKDVLGSARKGLTDAEEDTVLERLSELFRGKVAPAPSRETHAEAIREAQQRYREYIPPGYRDLPASKQPTAADDEPPVIKAGNPYGDYLIWREMLSHATETERPMLFVTRDMKDDWWHTVRGEARGPRKELIKEFRDTTAQDIDFYEPKDFYTKAGRFVEMELTDATKEELDRLQSTDFDRVQDILDEFAERAAEIKRLLQGHSLPPAVSWPAGLPDQEMVRTLSEGIQDHFKLAGYTEKWQQLQELVRRYGDPFDSAILRLSGLDEDELDDDDHADEDGNDDSESDEDE